jgi:hypothetical protein
MNGDWISTVEPKNAVDDASLDQGTPTMVLSTKMDAHDILRLFLQPAGKG